MAYITFDDMQHLLIEHIRHGGIPLDYPEACRKAIELGLVHEEEPFFPRKLQCSQLTDEAFDQLLHQYPLSIMSEGIPPVWHTAQQLPRDIRVIQHLYNPNSIDHAPDRFIIFYAYKGSFDTMFERQHYQMQTGDVVIIAPGCRSIAYMPRESIVFSTRIQPDRFQTIFNELVDDSNVISTFLRSVLYSNNKVNYLLFHTDNDDVLKNCYKSFFQQQLNYDRYTMPAMHHTMGTLLAHLLRMYSGRTSYYHSNQQVNLPTILGYMQSNWSTLSLGKLADLFGYNQAYLSSMIRKATGRTYTSIINQLRMEDAALRLRQTNDRIADIAYAVGCHSPEHFSRSFRAYYGLSPEEYRQTPKKISSAT